MERYKIKKKQKNDKKQTFENRSPLQDLNGHQIHKTISQKSSNPSAAISPKCSLKFLRSSNTCAASSSTTQFDKKLKTLSKLTNNVPEQSMLLRARENEIPKKPFSKESKKNQAPCPHQWRISKRNANPSSRIGQRSKLSSDKGNPMRKLKKERQDFGEKIIISQQNDSGIRRSDNSTLNYVENCTPVGKITCGSGSDLANFDETKNIGEDSMLKIGNSTPPVEASVSPEIQCGSQSKMLISKPGATPVCYGAGHLLSGVTDKRKCRRRGSLKGGDEKVIIFRDGNVINDSHDCSVPILAEASVRWHSSPCDQELKDSEKNLEQCKITINGNDLFTLDLLSPPSSLCANISEFECQNSVLSIGSLSNGNVIQTPTSDSSCRSKVQVELDSITKSLNTESLSPRNEIVMWDSPDLASRFENMDSPSSLIEIPRLQKNVDSLSYWVSDSTLENLALSQMRISWRDTIENDEFDCCRCLSDDENGGRQSYLGTTGYSTKDESLGGTDCDLPLKVLDYEPVITVKKKENISNTCLESICTNGGSLFASDDSHWTDCFSNHLFQV